MRPRLLPIAVLAFLAACSANTPTPATDTAPAARTAAPPTTPATPTPPPAATSSLAPSAATTTAPTGDTAPAFVDIVWRAGPGTGVEAGSTYTFRRDGTLRMDAPHGTPGIGQWRYEGGKLTMVEDGIAYPTDIVSQDATHLVLRSHNPGGSVEIALVASSQPRR